MSGSARAQSEVIGTVLLLGLTIAVVGSTVALGSVALADSQQTADLQRVEGAMTQLDSKASLVAHGESPSQRLQLDLDRTADLRVDDEAGWMRIEVETDDGTTNETVPLGAVVYENGDDTVAYQGGGVWRSNGDGVRMVSPPEFHYRGSGGTETLTLPLVRIEDSRGPLQDSVALTDTGRPPERLFPSANGSNPLLGGNVTVTVGSEYAEAWGRFFESRTSATVTELGDDRVEVRLRTRTIHPTLSTGVSATGRSTFDMGGVDTMYADSFDSAEGTYESQDPRDGASVQTRDEFRLTAGGGGGTDSITIRGDLIAESYNLPGGQTDKLNVTGELREESAIGELAPVSGAITQRIDAVRALDLATNGDVHTGGLEVADGDERVIENDTYVDGGVSVSDGGLLRVTDGATLHVNGDVAVVGSGRIEFDTSGGETNALVEDGLNLSGDGAIAADGDGRANLYVDDAITLRDTASITTANDTHLEIYNTGDIQLDDNVSVAADGDVTSNLWFYSSTDQIDIRGDEGDGIEFTGVFYAPQSDVELEDRMTIKGSFTFRSFSFNDGDIRLHYDESLRELQPFGGDSVPVVSHLHVSTHGVTVSAD
ncbi:hypothetical protein C461_04987 [Halorubrum aidingense JCM 13560]|uniref:DUF7305 domain-containing protein n=1 Tax=Halorubrum aidingense JCM 13560 TaxID=1230454 RepID=M0PGD5_9EURY|nr:hypothetical protein [Halorubrum aidingense]EMA68958.1 hypothetical protein C461_04987 [Halorubrum aidingense JCM 13560]